MQRKAPLHTEPYDSLCGSGEGIPPEHLLFNVEKKQKQTKQPFVSGKAIQRGTLIALMCNTESTALFCSKLSVYALHKLL